MMMGPAAREVLAGGWSEDLWTIILATVFVFAILLSALLLSRRFFWKDPEALHSFLAEALEAKPAQDPRPVE
jgi:hypothetical protein